LTDPENPAWLGARGNFEHEHGDLANARTDLEQAARLAPDDPGIGNDLATVYSATRKWTRAAIALDRAIALRPDYSAAFVNRGVLLSLQGRRNAALRAFEQAAAADPTNPYAHTNLGVDALTRGKPDKAIEHATRATANGPRYDQGYGILGQALLSLDRAEEAVAALTRAVELNGWDVGHLHALAVAFTRTNDLDRAIGTIAILLSRFPDAAEALTSDPDLAPLTQSQAHESLFVHMARARSASAHEPNT
jgi:tetratricopeptide (TPR) repeat protein